MLKFLNGRKTYLAAILFALVAIGGFWFGQVDATQLGFAFSVALGIAGVGHKLDKQKDALLDLLVTSRDEWNTVRSVRVVPDK